MKKNEIQELKKLLSSEQADLIPHLTSDLGLGRYIKMADNIVKVVRQGNILDWGCGLGQMTYLLKNRGLQVESYDLAAGGQAFLSKIGQKIIIGRDPVKLPYPDSIFDVVLSSGVLEHVAKPQESLEEIVRVLKKGGYFFINMLPNKYSYVEFLSRILNRSDHPVRYAMPEIISILKESGFEVLSSRYQGFLPYNLKGFLKIIKGRYHMLDGIIGFLDPILTNLPITKLLSTNIELVVRKK